MPIGGYRGEPIKVGVLIDSAFGARVPGKPDLSGDTFQGLRMALDEAVDAGDLDRPVEFVAASVRGLPVGDVKTVIDAYGDLVDQGCLVIYGPQITENTIPLRPEIEQRFRVPALSMCGADDWLGEWTFGLPSGSMTDEPIVIAHVMAQAGHKTAGVLVERSVIGQLYYQGFVDVCRRVGIDIVATEIIPQTGADITDAVRKIRDARPDALVHWGFGFGLLENVEALRAADWDPPRYMGTAFQDVGIGPEIRKAWTGWAGIDQIDEENKVGQRVLDRFEAKSGRRPTTYGLVVGYDFGTAIARALANAQPLSPRGVLEGLERVKMIPAASGAPGTAISFGKWTRRGWMGPGYLVVRKFDSEEGDSRLIGRFEAI